MRLYMELISMDDLSLPRVTDCNTLTAAQNFYHMDRIADFHVLIYVTNGTMYVTENNQDHTISKGEIFFLKNGIRHYGSKETLRGTSWLYVHFYLPEKLMGNKILLPKKISGITKTPIEEKLFELCSCFRDSCGKNKLRTNALLYNILLELYMNQPSEEKLCNKICAYLKTQVDKDFTKELVHEKFYLSYSYLAARFKSEIGMSMGQYHNNLRMKKACMLLQSTLLSVGEIANRLGFSDVLYFSKKFHVYSGLSPSDYRKQAQMRY